MTSKPHSAWTLNEWLDYLEHRHKPEVQLRLINAQSVARHMNLLEWSIPVITVGGTNGKGSTVTALSAIYEAAGYKVGQFTSPHLLKFNERICVNRQAISDEDLCEALGIIEQDRQAIPLTYFEMSLLAALWYFQRNNLDVIILEVGVGGRLDATNIIDADLAIITTVDLDHQDYLGPDKESIGVEKAGILRSHQPFIYADNDPPLSVLSQATALKTDMQCLGKTYSYEVLDNSLFIMRDNESPIQLPLPAIHLNAAVAAVLASDTLRGILPVQYDHWAIAMRQVHVMGRLQWVMGSVTILYDVAHNPQASALLARTIKQFNPSGKVHAVFSALKDKDICGLISPLSTIVDQWYPVCLTGKRATSSEDLLAAFTEVLNVNLVSYANPKLAYQAAAAAAVSGDVIVIYGSFILVGAVLGAMKHGMSSPVINTVLPGENHDKTNIR